MESDLVKAQSTLAKLAAEVDDLTRRLDRLTQR
jgi:phage shock protein A